MWGPTSPTGDDCSVLSESSINAPYAPSVFFGKRKIMGGFIHEKETQKPLSPLQQACKVSGKEAFRFLIGSVSLLLNINMCGA